MESRAGPQIKDSSPITDITIKKHLVTLLEEFFRTLKSKKKTSDGCRPNSCGHGSNKR